MKQKTSKIDYSKAMLPRTRKAQLGDCFKMNYSVILKCGLFLLVFFIPLLAFSLFMDFYYLSLMNTATEEIEQTRIIFFYILVGGLVLLSLPVIVSISGITHILRNLIWGEGIYLASDFKTGIKQNAPKNLIFGLIMGALFSLSYFVATFFTNSIISFIPLIIAVVIFFPIYLWLIFLNNTYASKWPILLKNSVFFYVKTIGYSLLGLLMVTSLVFLVFLPFSFIWLKYIFLVLFTIFVFPIIFLVMTLYTTAKFDQYINIEYYPDYYLKGLNH